MHEATGKFISFEGCDGVGKSTQLALLAKRLENAGYRTMTTREPGGSELAEQIRDILKKTSMDPLAELFLLTAARRDHFLNRIKPALDQGYIVICDRFYDSTLVYQGVLKKVSIQDILNIQQIALGDFEPDITILLDMDYKSARYRSQIRNPELFSNDAYDSMSEEKYKLISDAYVKLASALSHRYIKIKASGTITSISDNIYNLVCDRFCWRPS